MEYAALHYKSQIKKAHIVGPMMVEIVQIQEFQGVILQEAKFAKEQIFHFALH